MANDVFKRCEQSLEIPRSILEQKKFTLDFFFSDEHFFNAHSAVDGNSGKIAISAAVVPMLLQVARSVVTGGARLLKNDSESIAFESMDVRALMLDYGLYQPLPNGNDEFLVMSSVYIAIDVLLNHELVHIANGHNAWGKQALGIGDFDERESEPEQVDYVRQTLEWDADSVAIQRSLLRCLGVKLNPPGENEQITIALPPYGPHGCWEQCLYAFGLGLYVLFRLFGHMKGTGRYPPTWYRVQTGYFVILNALMRRMVPPIINRWLMPVEYRNWVVLLTVPVLEAAKRAEKVWCERTTQPPILADVWDMSLNDGAKPTRIYNACWRSIAPSLEEHCLIPSLWDAI